MNCLYNKKIEQIMEEIMIEHSLSNFERKMEIEVKLRELGWELGWLIETSSGLACDYQVFLTQDESLIFYAPVPKYWADVDKHEYVTKHLPQCEIQTNNN